MWPSWLSDGGWFHHLSTFGIGSFWSTHEMCCSCSQKVWELCLTWASFTASNEIDCDVQWWYWMRTSTVLYNNGIWWGSRIFLDFAEFNLIAPEIFLCRCVFWKRSYNNTGLQTKPIQGFLNFIQNSSQATDQQNPSLVIQTEGNLRGLKESRWL